MVIISVFLLLLLAADELKLFLWVYFLFCNVTIFKLNILTIILLCYFADSTKYYRLWSQFKKCTQLYPVKFNAKEKSILCVDVIKPKNKKYIIIFKLCILYLKKWNSYFDKKKFFTYKEKLWIANEISESLPSEVKFYFIYSFSFFH